MPVVDESVFIARSPEDVFEYVNQADNLSVWDSSIIEAEQIDEGSVRVGTRIRGTSKILGRRFEWTTEVTEFQPSTLASSRAVEGKLRFTVSYTFSPENGGTRLTNRVEAESGLGGVFGRLADPMVVKAQRRTVRANLDTLAELLAQPDG